MWTSNRPLNAKLLARPVRVAYLIPESFPDEVFDKIFSECYSRWGGRRTPVIPTDGTTIDKIYWEFLDKWDADIIYSYAEINDELENRLYYCFAPAKIMRHSEVRASGEFLPDFEMNFSFTSSLSFLPYFAQRTKTSAALPLPKILDYQLWDNHYQDFADSFGFLSKSTPSASLQQFARIMTCRKDEKVGYFSPSECIFLESEDAWLANLVDDRNVLLLSGLSDFSSPYLTDWSNYSNGWNDHLTVVIGDSAEDRLLMWNAQHRYSGLSVGDDIPVFRVSERRFENDAPDWLKKWINLRNSRQLRQNAAKRVTLRSCSLSKERLCEIAKLISERPIMVEHHQTPNVFDIKPSNDRGSDWTYSPSSSVSNRFRGKDLEIPLLEPWHFSLGEKAPRFQGIWAIDLTIDRLEDHSVYEDRPHVWKFPRRLRLDTAIDKQHYAQNIVSKVGLLNPPSFRPTRDGNLVVWDSATWTRPILSLPSDYEAFFHVLHRIPYDSPEFRRRVRREKSEEALASSKGQMMGTFLAHPERFARVSVSDKGRDLLGVLQLFGSLPEALQFLNNKFWLDLIQRLSPEELQDKEKYIKEICDELNTYPKTSDLELREIVVHSLRLAAKSFASQKLEIVDFEKIYDQAKLSLGADKDRNNKIRNEVESSVEYLRNCNFLWQGFNWKCRSCDHHNWVGLDRLSIISNCEICRKGRSSQVAGSLHFRLNSFVQHAFASSSSQGAVLWCLQYLASKTRLPVGDSTQCFAFAPAMDIFKKNESDLWTDVDITANVNGKIYLVEVKRSHKFVRMKDLDKLLELANELRPDVLLLAVQEVIPSDWSLGEEVRKLAKQLKELDVRFEIFTLADDQTLICETGIAQPFRKQMNWTPW